MRISDGRDCPVRPDDELACLFYPTLTELPEQHIYSSAQVPVKKAPRRPRRLWLLLLLLAVITAVGLMLPQQKAGANYSPDLVLKNFDRVGISEYAFGTEIRKEDITSITFQDTLKAAPADAVDVSETGNGRVLLWADGDHLFIAGDGKVFFPADSSCLFGGSGYYGYGDLRQIDFHDAVDTSRVTDMSGMFSRCISLASLDLGGFSTGKVTDMSGMFYSCSRLTDLDLSRFDVHGVTDMGTMFMYCSRLTNLDMRGLNTGNLMNRRRMFFGCSPALALETNDQRIRNQFLEDTR